MEEYKDISRGLKMLLDKAEEMGWNWEAYIEPDNRRTYVEIGQSSPAGEDFSMVIDFDEENQADSFKDSLESYYEDFDIDEHIEMWIEAKRSKRCVKTQRLQMGAFRRSMAEASQRKRKIGGKKRDP